MPRGHLLPAMTPELIARRMTLPVMKRQGAIVIAEPGRAMPLAKSFFSFARLWLAGRLNGLPDEDSTR